MEVMEETVTVRLVVKLHTDRNTRRIPKRRYEASSTKKELNRASFRPANKGRFNKTSSSSY